MSTTRESEIGLLPRDLALQSLRPAEIVLSYDAAISAVHHLHDSGVHILGWEGWLRHPDGRLGHSALHQGTTSLGDVPPADAAAICIRTIRDAHSESIGAPERGELYFCIFTNAA